MKIALLGYGKMGKEIEQIAIERAHEIVFTKTRANTFDGLQHADVAIDFSIPSAAVENIKTCISYNVPVVSGTTGWLNQYQEIVDFTQEKNGTFLYASNFSIGVNLFFKVNQYLAQLMSKHTDYSASIEEIHHTQKLDAPSGTAITLAQQIIENSNYSDWKLTDDIQGNKQKLEIKAIRENDVPGTHTISYKSEIDTLAITHIAQNRKGFALGAVIAAEWIYGKKGVFSMNDVLDL